jgi:uncharacterized 2Fe-2S/4Fe-4S cluster protein (DUF4445 family)
MPAQTPPSKFFFVSLQPTGRRGEARPGMSLLAVAQAAGVELVSLCGGIGSCDSCKVRLVKGKLSPPTLEEQALFSEVELEQGYRLACQASAQSDVVLDIPPESLTTPQRLQVEGQGVEVAADPVVLPIDLQLEPPTLDDLRSDITRLRAALEKTAGRFEPTSPLQAGLPHLRHPLLKSLPAQLRSYNWSVRLSLRGDEIVAALPPATATRPAAALLGLAVDIGTTKVAAYLTDLLTGKVIAKAGAMNPQIAFGEDVISRIAYANANPEGSNTLQHRLAHTLNEMAAEMCRLARLDGVDAVPEHIVEAVVVGNTAMHHLFAGLAVTQLGASPYVPAVSEAVDIPAQAVGLNIAPGAYVHLPPNIAGYVGADHVAMLMAALIDPHTGAPPQDRTVIALDIGTNTEITLAHKGKMISCSCASGPAFEGAHIRDGMRAAPGAIERVQVAGEHVRIHTIGDQPPVGICGSGILDAVAQMLTAQVIDFRGVLKPGHPAARIQDGRVEFVLAPAEISGHGRDVLVNRKDVNEIQLAKGAIRAGINILMLEAGLEGQEQSIDEFIVAGAFGTYISIDSAVQIGMFPDIPLKRYRQVGNAAGSGAQQMLISGERRRLASKIVSQIEYVELSAHPDFLQTFSQALYFPKQAH